MSETIVVVDIERLNLGNQGFYYSSEGEWCRYTAVVKAMQAVGEQVVGLTAELAEIRGLLATATAECERLRHGYIYVTSDDVTMDTIRCRYCSARKLVGDQYKKVRELADAMQHDRNCILWRPTAAAAVAAAEKVREA